MTATGLPDWLTFDETSLSLRGTPAQSGDYEVVITATDESGLSEAETVIVRVDEPTAASEVQEKILLVVVDDFTQRSLEQYDNVTLYNFGSRSTDSLLDFAVDPTSGEFTGYGDIDEIVELTTPESGFFKVDSIISDNFALSAKLIDTTIVNTGDNRGYGLITENLIFEDENTNADVGHGDWVVEAINQTLHDPSRVELLCIDVDTLNGWDSHLDDLFDQTSFSFAGQTYNDSWLVRIIVDFLEDNSVEVDPYNNYDVQFSGMSISIAGAPADYSNIASFEFFETLSAPIFQAAPNVGQGYYDWGSNYPNVINVGVWNSAQDASSLFLRSPH